MGGSTAPWFDGPNTGIYSRVAPPQHVDRAGVDVGAVLVRLGLKVAELRVARGMTQEQFAEAMGMDARDLQRIEQGTVNFTMRRLVHLASALGCEPMELLAAPASTDAGPGRRKGT